MFLRTITRSHQLQHDREHHPSEILIVASSNCDYHGQRQSHAPSKIMITSIAISTTLAQHSPCVHPILTMIPSSCAGLQQFCFRGAGVVLDLRRWSSAVVSLGLYIPKETYFCDLVCGKHRHKRSSLPAFVRDVELQIRRPHNPIPEFVKDRVDPSQSDKDGGTALHMASVMHSDTCESLDSGLCWLLHFLDMSRTKPM